MRARKVREDWRGQVLLECAPKHTGRVEPEASVVKRSLEVLWAAGGVHAMRNNVGAIKKGSRFIRYGLEKGSADYICIVAPYGRMLCLEFKRGDGGEEADDQIAWLAKMRNYGAVADFCSSPERALELLAEARKPPEWQR